MRDAATFAAGAWFWALWAVPAGLALVLFFEWSARRRAEAFSSRSAGLAAGLTLVNWGLVLGGVALQAVALARPRWGADVVRVPRAGADIICAIDTSRSMLARDLPGGKSRMERARERAGDLIALLQGERIGFMAFAGAAVVACPLTADYAAARVLLEDIGVGTSPMGGTQFVPLIERALRSFEKGSPERALIIFTDGEDHSEGAIEAAKKAKDAGVRIYCLGVGSVEGANVRIQDETGKKSYLCDRDGRIVQTQMNERFLASLAAAGDGAYARSSAGLSDLHELYTKRIARLAGAEGGEALKKLPIERFRWALLPAFLMTCAALGVPRWRKEQ